MNKRTPLRVKRLKRDECRSHPFNIIGKPSSMTKFNNESFRSLIQPARKSITRIPNTVTVQHVSRFNSTAPHREPTMDSGSISLNMSSLDFYSNQTRNSCRSRMSLETTCDSKDRNCRSSINHLKQESRRNRFGYPCCSPCCCLLTGILLSLLLALLGAWLVSLLLFKSTTTTTTTTTTSQTTTTSTTSTTTTSTTSTSTSTTTSTTSTTTTSTTTSTSTTSTTSTTTSTTSTTSTSSTSTSTTSATTTITTATTSTSRTTTTATTTTTASTMAITSNSCTVGWGGVTIFTFCTNCLDIPSYQQYTYTYTAIATNTRIAFAVREDSGYFAVDDISVRSVTAPSVELLINGGFETGTYSPWIHCVPPIAYDEGVVKSNSDYFQYSIYTYTAHGGNFYYLDGVAGAADYISQVFATIIGETYTISFWVYNQGSGFNSDFRIIMSI